ncbi:hypothetical protein B0H19DRAFT_1150071 [Mycena capillaripes]|nr:hypothetical protein B0H19DRAFT_1150071 [Mycena capillaripes]
MYLVSTGCRETSLETLNITMHHKIHTLSTPWPCRLGGSKSSHSMSTAELASSPQTRNHSVKFR